jgi:hypothetical protein
LHSGIIDDHLAQLFIDCPRENREAAGEDGRSSSTAEEP